MASEKMKLVMHVGGKFVFVYPDLGYEGGDVLEWQVDVDYLSFEELRGRLDKLGYRTVMSFTYAKPPKTLAEAPVVCVTDEDYQVLIPLFKEYGVIHMYADHIPEDPPFKFGHGPELEILGKMGKYEVVNGPKGKKESNGGGDHMVGRDNKEKEQVGVAKEVDVVGKEVVEGEKGEAKIQTESDNKSKEGKSCTDDENLLQDVDEEYISDVCEEILEIKGAYRQVLDKKVDADLVEELLPDPRVGSRRDNLPDEGTEGSVKKKDLLGDKEEKKIGNEKGKKWTEKVSGGGKEARKSKGNVAGGNEKARKGKGNDAGGNEKARKVKGKGKAIEKRRERKEQSGAATLEEGYETDYIEDDDVGTESEDSDGERITKRSKRIFLLVLENRAQRKRFELQKFSG